MREYKRKIDRERLKELHALGWTAQEMAEYFHADASQVRKVTVDLGLEHNKPKRRFKVDRVRFKEMIDSERTREEIAFEFGVSENYVRDKAKAWFGYSFPVKRMGRRKIDWDMVADLSRTTNLSVPEIAERVGGSAREVSRIRVKLQVAVGRSQNPASPETHGRVRAMIAERTPYAEIRRTLGVSARWLRKHYPGQGLTASEAAEYRHMRERFDNLFPDV